LPATSVHQPHGGAGLRLADELTGEEVSANTPLALGPWDVRVLIACDGPPS
jgi:hypothetical protein